MNFSDRSTSAQRLYGIAEALCLAVGNAIRPGFISAAIAMLVVRRIFRIRGALWALEARFLAGRAMRRPARVVGASEAPAREDVAPRVRAGGLPRRRGWLFNLVPSYAATYAGQLRVVLAEPGMQALLAASPQAVRVLRPLCVMLGIERAAYMPNWVEPERPAVMRVRAPRKVREAVDLAVEDAHYAFTRVPRRFRLRIG